MMRRNDIIIALKEYFDIRELVCPDVYARFGEKSWMFLSTEALETLLVLRRDILQVPLVCNNWASGGQFSQRGLRCNLCNIVSSKTKVSKLYMSAHCNGCAFDVTSPKMTADEMRRKIQDNWRKLPYNIRVERDVSWLHFDTYDNGEIITWFKG